MISAQTWKGSSFCIERTDDQAVGFVLFRLSGPLTARAMYGAISPAAFRDLLEADPDSISAAEHVLDLTNVPYLDSAGVGVLSDHLSHCTRRGIRMQVVGLGRHVIERLNQTWMAKLVPVAETVYEVQDRNLHLRVRACEYREII